MHKLIDAEAEFQLFQTILHALILRAKQTPGKAESVDAANLLKYAIGTWNDVHKE